MVHFTAHRPRILAHETPLIYGLVWAKLSKLHEERSQPHLATQLFKILYRYVEYRPGRPSYPEPVTWDLIEDYVGIVEEAEEGPTIVVPLLARFDDEDDLEEPEACPPNPEEKDGEDF